MTWTPEHTKSLLDQARNQKLRELQDSDLFSFLLLSEFVDQSKGRYYREVFDCVTKNYVVILFERGTILSVGVAGNAEQATLWALWKLHNEPKPRVM